MEFGDGQRAGGRGAPVPAASGEEPRRGFLSWVFGNRGSPERKEADEDMGGAPGSRDDLGSAGNNGPSELTFEAMGIHNDAHGETKSTTDAEVRSVRSRASSARSRSSRGSRLSRSSVGSKVSKSSRALGGHGTQHFQHDDAIEEGDEENESEFSYFEETFDEMRKRHDIETLSRFPPGERAQFFAERRESYRDLPLPPPPTHKLPQVKEEEEEYMEPDQGDAQEEETGETQEGEQEEVPGSPVPAPSPLPELTKKERLAYLRRTLPPESRALLNRALKEQKKLRKEFKSKLTLVSLSGEKKIPKPRPQYEPPLPLL